MRLVLLKLLRKRGMVASWEAAAGGAREGAHAAARVAADAAAAAVLGRGAACISCGLQHRHLCVCHRVAVCCGRAKQATRAAAARQQPEWRQGVTAAAAV